MTSVQGGGIETQTISTDATWLGWDAWLWLHRMLYFRPRLGGFRVGLL